MLADLPLPLAIDLQPGAVEDLVERPGGLLGLCDMDRSGAATERGGVGDGQVEVPQIEGRAGEPLGGPQGEVGVGPQGQPALDADYRGGKVTLMIGS